MAMDIIKRFDKDVNGNVILYKIVGVNTDDKGNVYFFIRVGVPRSDRKKEYTFKLTLEEVYLFKEFFEEALKEMTKIRLEESKPKKVTQQKPQHQQTQQTQQQEELFESVDITDKVEKEVIDF